MQDFRVRLFLFRARRTAILTQGHGRLPPPSRGQASREQALQGGVTLLWMKPDVL